jgi:hypothetical protein
MAIAKPCMGLPQLLILVAFYPFQGQQEVTNTPDRRFGAVCNRKLFGHFETGAFSPLSAAL